MLEEKELEAKARMMEIMSSLSEDWELTEEDLSSINSLFKTND